jgi:enamine deaminase RidA (YjgF/YER057c/UK114 family)
MAKQYFNPDTISTPPNGVYSHIVKDGNTIYVAGQLGQDKDSNPVGGSDAGAQYLQIWANIDAALASVGATVNDLVKTTTYVVGIENLTAVRAAREKVAPAKPPTSTMVVVAALARPWALVEVEAIASLP